MIVGGKVVRASTGRNDERLLPEPWDVREFAGKKAHIEIVDEEKGPWGHINIDQIEFSDVAMSAVDVEAAERTSAGSIQRDPPEPTNKQGLLFDDLQLEPEPSERRLPAGSTS